jgi:exopolysaccharide biosynthesis predicted pyruvyltransferase EpsI
MFLDFVKEQGVKKIAYAASFGVDNWEFTPKQSKKCRKFAQQLDSVSVRENSGIALCRNSLNIEAVEVLDPTLLISADTYNALCADVAKPQERYIGAYILDSTPEKVALVEAEAKRRGVACKIYGAHDNLELSVEEWLAMFKNAECVITDSFHGCVFSIIFRKEFVALLNSGRGESRFKSLLGKFDLSHRIVTDPKQGVIPSEPIAWSAVEEVLAKWQKHSLNYIENILH